MKELASKQLSRYALRKELSHKAGRRTFLATDLETQTPVIVKVLQLGKGFQWDDLKLFEREAKILQQISYPTIPQYQDSFETEIEGVPSFVLVQTYIAAPSLQSVVDAGQLFSEAEVVAIARQLLTTLSYLHQQLPSVIHRDIKPSNILISQPSLKAKSNKDGVVESNVYLIDFGAVQITASKNSGTVTIVGSYGYMPLEQFLGQTTPQSDLYSLGMTLIFLLTGTHPAELPQVNGRVQIERIGEISGLSDRFTYWLSRLSAPYADHRFESADIALATLDAKDRYSGYFPHLKPANSKVSIYRDRHQLAIISPPAQPSGTHWITYVFAAIPILGFSISLGTAFGLPIPILNLAMIALYLTVALLAVYLCVRALWWLIILISQTVHSKSYSLIAIDQQAGIQIAEARGSSPEQVRTSKRRKKQSAPFHSITLLTYTPGYKFKRSYQMGFTKKQRAGVSLSPKLSIHAGRKEFIVSEDKLSAADLLWIAKELSDFLNLPLQTISPTDEETHRTQAGQKPASNQPVHYF
ncbi:MAG: serine/threonine protein kinase [Phormidesmis sp.]